MGDFYAYNIKTKSKEKLQDYEVGIMKIKGIEKDTSRYFVRGKISDGSTRYVFINEEKYKTLKKEGIRDAGTIVKQRKEKKNRKSKSRSKEKKTGGYKVCKSHSSGRKSRSRSRSSGRKRSSHSGKMRTRK